MFSRREVLQCSLVTASFAFSPGCAAPGAYIRAEQYADALHVPLSALNTEQSHLVYVETLGATITLRASSAQEPVEWEALLLVCTHRGCNVAPSRTGFVCPCHGSTFSASGEPLTGPADRPLQRLPTQVSASVLVVQLPRSTSPLK